jgi:hypothetical protein
LILRAMSRSTRPRNVRSLRNAFVRAFELLGVRVTLMRDQRVLADALIGLPQRHAVLLRQPNEPFVGSMHELGVRWKSDGLFLHRRVDDDPGEVGRLRRACLRRHGQALLDKRRELLLAHPLTPARKRRAVKGRLVLEKLLAAKELKIGVLDPALA